MGLLTALYSKNGFLRSFGLGNPFLDREIKDFLKDSENLKLIVLRFCQKSIRKFENCQNSNRFRDYFIAKINKNCHLDLALIVFCGSFALKEKTRFSLFNEPKIENLKENLPFFVVKAQEKTVNSQKTLEFRGTKSNLSETGFETPQFTVKVIESEDYCHFNLFIEENEIKEWCKEKNLCNCCMKYENCEKMNSANLCQSCFGIRSGL